MTAALDVLSRVPSILVFLTALTIVSECCSIAGVFDNFADRIVNGLGGRIWAVWSSVMVLSCLVTAFLSLDTTAVLMTTVAVAVARRLDRPIAAFVFPVLWIANMASMWLPVSNLTTLLARDVLPHPDALSYLAHAWPVALTCTVTPLVVAVVMFGRHLSGRTDVASFREASALTPAEALTRRLVSLVVLCMSASLLILEPAIGASVSALLCWAIIWRKLPDRRRDVHLPWASLAMTSALFCAVALLHGLGVLDALTREFSSGPSWHLALGGAVSANLANNLPAYLALEPAAQHQTARVLALLVGVNVASGITWWGSVATLLWRDRLSRQGVKITLREHLWRTGFATLATTTSALVVLTIYA